MQMQLASNSVLSQPPLAAMPQLSEKPRLGFATKKTTWNPGPNVCNFTVTLGLQVVVSENGVRKTYSARYYNPATGRFLSRDPNEPALRGSDGTPTDPAYLHKYLYANGDPINGIDPMGREALIEMKLIKKFLAVPAVMGLRIAAATICAEYEFMDRVLLEPFEHGIPWPAMLPCDLYAIGEGALLVAELVAD
jgi:RHS repeat-associated protein